jgi:PAS domain S-box-containing protein
VADWSSEVYELFDVEPGEFGFDLVRAVEARVHPDDAPRLMAMLSLVAERREASCEEVRVLAHGEYRCMRVGAVPEVGDDGCVPSIAGYVQDVTEQRQAERDLRLAYDRLDIAQQAAGAGAFEFDAATERLRFSPQLCHLFGFDSGTDAVGFDTLRRVVHPDDVEATFEAYWSAIREGTPLQVEYRVLRPDGELRWIDSSGHGQYDDQGRPVGMLGLCIDVTERKRGEQALLESADRHRAILQTAVDGFMLVDATGRLVEVNDAYCRMSGYAMEELLEMTLSDLESAETSAQTQAHIEKVISAGEDRFDTRHRHKDGSSFDLDVNVQFHPAQDQFVVFLHDVSERKRMERMLKVPSDILSIMSTTMAAPEMAARIVRTLKEATGFDAVGIRLREGEDYPFVAAMGYSDDFLRAENSLTTIEPGVGLCRTADGAIALDCTCGMVISGATDPSNPLFTPGGSAWTGDASRAQEGPPVEDLRLRPRDRCVHVGFRSIALVPLRAGDQTLGLLHLADNGPGRFTPESIGFFEGLGASIGVALLREQAEAELAATVKELHSQLSDTIKAMGALVGMRDPYTAAHERRVTALAVAIGADMELGEEQLEGLSFAGEVHDIGKVAVPAEILTKPAKLSGVEFTIVKMHAEASRDILSSINFRQPVVDIVAQHHERLDGSGYPDGLRGDEILPEARILAVADVVEAMASHRPYRAGLGLDAALEEVRTGAGVRYDAAAVAACERVFASGFSFPDD